MSKKTKIDQELTLSQIMKGTKKKLDKKGCSQKKRDRKRKRKREKNSYKTAV